MKDINCMRCDTPITVIALADGLHITWAEYYADSLIPWSELGVTAVTFKHPEQHGVKPETHSPTCGVCEQPISGYVYHCYRCNQTCCDQHSSFVEDMQGSDHTGNFHTCCDDCLKANAPSVVAASDVMSVAEAQRLGIGEHERSCTCPLCAGDEPMEGADVLDAQYIPSRCDLCKKETDDLKQCSKCGAWCCFLDWFKQNDGSYLCSHCDWAKTYGEAW